MTTLSINGAEQLISDREQLRGIILALHRDSNGNPKLVQLISPQKSTLTIAVGSPISILNYIEPSGWPAKTALGDEAAEGLLKYTICDEISEFPARFGIPFDQALGVALEFFDKGNVEGTLTWLDD